MADDSIWSRFIAVGKNVDGFQLQVWNFVEVLHVEPRAVGCAGALRSDLGKNSEAAILNRAAAVDAELNLITELRPMGPRHEVFLARIHRLDRTYRHFCENGRLNFRQIDAGAQY